MKGLPFTIDRSQRWSLVDQMADGLRRAIKSGVYRKGDRLPAVRELVAHFGVSSRIPVAAFKKLSEEGLVDAIPHKGCIVRALRLPVWKGHVVCIVPSGDFSYANAVLSGCVRAAITGAGYLFTQVTVPRLETGRLDMGLLDYTLQQPVDFAVLLGRSHQLAARLEKAGVPFVSQDFDECRAHKMCRAVYGISWSRAYRQFAAICGKRRVGRVRRVVKRAGTQADLDAVLANAGISADEWSLSPRRQGRGRLEILRQAAYNAVEALIGEGRDRLPGALFFEDDYMATGAMAALCANGVRFPEDVRIATLVNSGNAPVFSGRYDRFEIDQEECGKTIADAVIKCITGQKVPFRLTFKVRFEPSVK